MFQLFVAEAHQRFERDLVRKEVCLTEFEHFGVDEALDQSEYVGVCAPLDLTEKASLGVV